MFSNFKYLLLLATSLYTGTAYAASGAAFGSIFLALAIILLFARLFSPLLERLGMPAVLGELIVGITLGNLSLVGLDYFETLRANEIIQFIAELGVIVLMFQIGLETRLNDLLKVGVRASAVGIVGIITPFILGAFIAGPLLIPGMEINTYLFLGATLAATSVGITGRVFKDLRALDTQEAKIVLGAAIIDDVLGLLILAVLSGLVQAGHISFPTVGGILLNALLFLVGTITLGRLITPFSSRWLASIDKGPSMLFAQVLATGLFCSWLAQKAGLAPIIGAFGAGLLFEPVFLKSFRDPAIVQEITYLVSQTRGNLSSTMETTLTSHANHQYRDLLEPLGYFFIPVFFVFTGMQVQLETLTDPTILLTSLGISVVAILGKLVAGFCAGRGVRPWIIGWGMVPRGEVGLIFASIGKQLGVVNDAMFSVIIIMVVVTTMVTPPILSHLLRKSVVH